MNIQISSYIPKEYLTKRPLKTYETQFLYTGLSRYNVETKTLSKFEVKDDKVFYSEVPYDGTVFSRSYNVELAHVTIYSESPKVWAERTNPFHVDFFQQIPQKETS